MLSQKTIEVIKSTIPALTEHSVALTTLFYTKMFENNPEVKPFFNSSNQAGGQQQRALAGAIVAFAKNVDNIPALASAVELISNKHASLMIKPEHYPIVGANLLASIQELLSLPEDHDIITAWGEGYWFLANVLIEREKELYAANAKRDGGWAGFRQFRIARRVKESSLITSFYLEPEDGEGLPEYLPGQYITVRVPTPDGSTTMRNYSLSDVSSTQAFRISVKHEKGSKGSQVPGFVSTYLHTVLEEGGMIEVGPPCGEFVLDTDIASTKPLVFLAGGIGITPLMSMVKTTLAKNPDRPTVFAHACLNAEVQAFRASLDEMEKQYPKLTLRHRYAVEQSSEANSITASHGLVDASFLENVIDDRDADYFICGPASFMTAMTNILKSWKIPAAQIRLEAFGPNLG